MKNTINSILCKFGLSHPVLESQLNGAFEKEAVAVMKWAIELGNADINRREQFAGSSYESMYEAFIEETKTNP